jgi:biopolymer transport protein ExbD
LKFSRRRSNRMLVEPPAVMLTDLAFNLVIFFVVCASTEPESGRKQDVPSSRKEENTAQVAKNIEVSLTRTTASINGEPTPLGDFPSKLKAKLAGKTRPEERIVVVKTEAPKDTPYQHWIRVTTMIEQAGGVVALQVEEGREIPVK